MLIVRLLVIGVACAVACAGCIGNYDRLYDEGGEIIVESIPSSGEVPAGCVRIQGGAIGEADVAFELAGDPFEVASWQTSDGDAQAFIGFTLASATAAPFAVLADGETHHVIGVRWEQSQEGASQAITSVTFCSSLGEPNASVTAAEHTGPGVTIE